MAEYNEEILDHEYDGIQEMDNNLPRWWLYLFYFSIVFAVVYMLYFHLFGIGYLQEDEYLQAMNPNYVRVDASNGEFLGFLPAYHPPIYKQGGDMTPRRAALAGGKAMAVTVQTAATDTVVYMAVTDAARLMNGADIFKANCATCHGQLGEGGIGPNLTDDYWLHGDGMSNVVKSVKYGYPSKGMISWRLMLKPEQIIDVSSHVLTLRGTNPPNPKAPQGELIAQ